VGSFSTKRDANPKLGRSIDEGEVQEWSGKSQIMPASDKQGPDDEYSSQDDELIKSDSPRNQSQEKSIVEDSIEDNIDEEMSYEDHFD